jgi:hypothetical protein
MNEWIQDIINKKEIKILENNEILSKILELFVNEDIYNQKISSTALSYNQLLCLLISTRFVLNTISNNDKDGLFYKLVIEPEKTIDDYKHYFKNYLKSYDEFNKEKREINYLTYKLINYIILSHLYFSYLLGNIKEIDKVIETLSLKIDKVNEEKHEIIEQKLLDILVKEFDFIKDEILNLIGIKKIIIFINYLFEKVSYYIINIKCSKDNNEFKNCEIEINNYINDEVIFKFENCVEDYYSKIKDLNKTENESNTDENIYKDSFIDIFLENDQFYNNKNKLYNFKFSEYYTYTNFCTFDDFKNQYLYFEYLENENYHPMIDYIVQNNNFIELIDLIPKLNEFINDIYNRLSLKISKNDLDKEIENTNTLKDVNFDSFNDLLKKIIEKINYKEDITITKKSKISEILNIKDKENKIYKLYKGIIDEYNNFLKQTKIYEIYKDIMDSVVIQSSSENDYMIFKNNKKENNQNVTISAEDRLKDIIILCSSRDRIKNDKINVCDGGKIKYNYDLIENILEEEFLLGKKLFSETQKTFIFSNNVFNDDSNNLLLKLKEKFEQKEIETNIIQEISKAIERDYNSKEAIIDFYYSLQCIIIYLMRYEINNKYIKVKMSINDLIKIVEKANYKIGENFTQFMETFKDSIFINNLLSFYELVELKAFQYLTKEIKMKKIVIKDETKKEIETKLKDDKLLLNDEVLTNAFKKFILRYYLSDNSNNLLEYMTNSFADMFNKIDIWSNLIFKDERFNEEKDKIISINNEDNCIIKYYCNKLFNNNDDDKEVNPPDDDKIIQPVIKIDDARVGAFAENENPDDDEEPQ